MDDIELPSESQPAPSTGTAEGKSWLGNRLKEDFSQYKNDRRAAEQQWMLNLNQFLGKYDPSLMQNMDQNTSRAYPKLTRTKCISMKARLMSLLFPAGEKNWGIEASPVATLPADTLLKLLNDWRAAHPQQQPTQLDLDQMVQKAAQDIAQRLEKVIDDQLKDVDPYGACDYETLVGRVVHSAVLYGPGIVKGPMTVVETTSRYELDAQGVPQLVTQDTYRPYLEFVSCWDYYPDMSASTFDQMQGEFQRHVYSKHQADRLADRADFDGDAIRKYINDHPEGNYTKATYESELEALGGQNVTSIPKGAKYEFVEYWGSNDASRLRAAGLQVPPELDGDVRFTAWVIDGLVVKLAVNPFPEGTSIYHRFIFEEDEVNLLGSGLPPIMRDSQLAVSSFARMLIDNASVVCGPNVEVNLELLSPTQTDYTIKPRKAWLKEGAANGERAVQSISFDSHISELTAAMQVFREFADTETFVSPLTGGDIEGVPGEAMRTTGGASMVYGNAALPFRDIVRNFDRFTVSVIDSLSQWNRIFYVDRDQIAGDTRPIPRGATSLMAKEVRAFALDQLAATLTPEERLYINEQELLKQRLSVRDLPLAQLLAPEDEVKRRQEAQAQQAQAQQAQAAAMFDAQLRNIGSDTLKQMSQAQKNLDNADVAVFKALIDAVNAGASPDELAGIARRITKGRQGTPTPSSGGAAGSAAAPGQGQSLQ